MAVVPAFSLECHHSLSISAFDALYPSDDFGRAFSVPILSKDSAEWIGRTETSLSSLTEVLDSLQIAVKQLQEHRGCLQIHINKQKTYVCSSPIRRLPPELLALIFSEACQSFERKDYLTPLSILVMCFRWRNIAISTPALWTNIFVGPVGGHNGADGTERLSLYMNRPKGLPISLKWINDKDEWLDEDGSMLSDDDDDFIALDNEHFILFGAVLSTSKSWRNVEFNLDEMDMFYAYTCLENDLSDISLLEHLCLRVNGYRSDTTLPPFIHAHKLRTLSLHTLELPFWTNQHILWPQIETLIVDVWDPSYMEQFLLDYGFVEGNKKTLIVDGEFPLVTSPSTQWLTRLVLRPTYLDDKALLSILSSICLPVLEELTLHNKPPSYWCGCCDTSEHTGILGSILQLLTRSAYLLRLLESEDNGLGCG